MAEAYKMEADKLKELLGERELEQMKKDMAVQKAVTVIADAAKEVEKLSNRILRTGKRQAQMSASFGKKSAA